MHMVVPDNKPPVASRRTSKLRFGFGGKSKVDGGDVEDDIAKVEPLGSAPATSNHLPVRDVPSSQRPFSDTGVSNFDTFPGAHNGQAQLDRLQEGNGVTNSSYRSAASPEAAASRRRSVDSTPGFNGMPGAALPGGPVRPNLPSAPGGYSGFDILQDSGIIPAASPGVPASNAIPGISRRSSAEPTAQAQAVPPQATGLPQPREVNQQLYPPMGGTSGPAAGHLHRQLQQSRLAGSAAGGGELHGLSERDSQLRKERTELIMSDVLPQPSRIEADISDTHNLIDTVITGSLAERKRAAHHLRMLAKHSDHNRGLIVEAGGVGPLVSLLSDADFDLVGEAVTALLNLSIHSGNKRIMPAQGAVEPLVQIMQTGTLESRENAAATMFSLSVVDDNKIIIGSAGAIAPLVDILIIGTEQGQRDALKALFNLSISAANKSRIVEAGATGPLVGYLQEPGSGMAEKSVSVLANLSMIPEGREAIAAEEEGIPGLVEVVESGSPRGKENAAAALWQLAKHNAHHRMLILQEVVLPPLVALSQTGTPRAKEKAEQLLKDFRDQR